MSGLVMISVVGAKPRITAPHSGSAMAICTAKQTAITPSSVTTKGFHVAETEILHPQHEEDVECGQHDADLERNVKEQIEPDGRADHLGKIRRANRNLGQHPERP